MLPKYHRKLYQKLLDSLTTLRAQIILKDINLEQLSQNFQVVQKNFQDQILGLTTENLEDSVVSSWESIQTEIHRTLRLLGTDFLFLQSSRKRETVKKRLEIVLDRIEKLIGYCQVIIPK